MSRLRLFISDNIEDEVPIYISKEDIHYLKNVLKVRNNEEIKIFNKDCGEWISEINIVSKDKIYLLPKKLLKLYEKKSYKISLSFSLLKRTNNNIVIQKATELNVSSIFPIITDRSIVRSFNSNKFKLIAKEASEQCGRLEIPEINNLSNIDEILKLYVGKKNIIICNNQDSSTRLDLIDNKIDYSMDSLVLIGPEGGFSSKELDLIKSYKDIYSVSLGNLVLRSETAVISSLYMINTFYEKNDAKY
ncbi:MAG: 16S rRNA (uracil1498-N3)-methyltransferase [Candidatus Midichloriaceae bacterium]|jgi:16S rRNA (uracil1498-N3)-methyltransferase